MAGRISENVPSLDQICRCQVIPHSLNLYYGVNQLLARSHFVGVFGCFFIFILCCFLYCQLFDFHSRYFFFDLKKARSKAVKKDLSIYFLITGS